MFGYFCHLFNTLVTYDGDSISKESQFLSLDEIKKLDYEPTGYIPRYYLKNIMTYENILYDEEARRHITVEMY